ncbi:MAG: CBS domain-containing protein [Gammaproteobacteria bacterium]|nr:MAG: CBS domain-containing protein [Gammaproteobacteria bacterium]
MRQLSDIVFNQKPLTMAASSTVAAACCEMRDQRIGSVLVTDNGSLVGIFTGRDAVGRVLAAGKSASNTTLAEVMTRDPKTMSPDQTAIEALRMMWTGGYRHLPVVRAGTILGVVSRGDFSGMEQDRLEEERQLWEHLR